MFATTFGAEPWVMILFQPADDCCRALASKLGSSSSQVVDHENQGQGKCNS
ncbi:hypothetical protein PGT21_020835 [Puccinia graminis f. sp. tritici]|uniref:Uncharacterized protein n=1 Tax=Puccinia graminis f. sp. tritici TaxID=56615 RepID=A0A5B0LUY1_PUCGR|nr:hypothetical protein PGT21_020835 [Puccinia graminis f. sp. tritici]